MQKKNGKKRMTMLKQVDLTFIDLQNQYLKKCQVNNLSEYTIQFYVVSCRTFGKFIDLNELKVVEITRELIDDYILHLKNTGVKDVTINTYIHGISPIIKHGMKTGVIDNFEFKEIKTNKEIKQVYTNEELSILLKKPDMRSFAEYRNWVIINFLLGTGVRSLELRNIKVKDIDLNSSMLIVCRTKTRKQRYIPISKRLHGILIEYLDFRKNETQDDYLFCNEFGEYLPQTTLKNAISKYCMKRGINKFSIHLFRHTFCKLWILNQGDIFTLQKILGHSSLKMVNHYSNLYADDLKKNFEKYCALDTIANNDRTRIKAKK